MQTKMEKYQAQLKFMKHLETVPKKRYKDTASYYTKYENKINCMAFENGNFF